MRAPAKPRTSHMEFKCDVSPDCLDCPLPVCRHDIGQHNTSSGVMTMLVEIVKDWQAGESVHQLSAKYGLDIRTIYRKVRLWRELEAQAQEQFGGQHDDTRTDS